MSDKLSVLTITVQKAADGSDYVQIMTNAAWPVNIVLGADRIDVEDTREDS